MGGLAAGLKPQNIAKKTNSWGDQVGSLGQAGVKSREELANEQSTIQTPTTRNNMTEAGTQRGREGDWMPDVQK